MPAQIFRHEHRVTYAECTVGNHVYYSRYLDLLEAARGEFFRQVGLTFQQWLDRDLIFPVIELSIKYLGPARYDDVLGIAVRVTALKGIRLSFGYRISTQEGRAILEAETRHICASTADKPKRLPDELVRSLEPYRDEDVENLGAG